MADAVEVLDRKHVGERPPGPRFRTPFGFLAAMRRDPLGMLTETARRYGDVAEIRFPPWSSILLVHPRDVRHVLQENHRNYWKGVIFQKLKRIGGEGLVFSDGALWRRQRQLAQPAFHRDRVAAMAAMMVDTTHEMLERWHAAGDARTPMDVAEAMAQLTLEIVAKALFGADLADDKTEFCAAVTGGLAYANHVMNHLFTPPLAVPTPANRRGRRAIQGIDRTVWKIIERRRDDGQDRGDLLSMLTQARDAETNEAMTDQQLRDECVTFLIAGHETTAVALSWAWHLLSLHPSAEQKLHAEIAEVLDGRTPTFGDLGALAYTRMVLEESMRLYPPVWATNRTAYDEDEVGGWRIPPGASVSLSPYVTHRHPAFWERPDEFDPERFSPARSAERPEYAYFPFGAGPRGCIGKQFAMMEGQIVLAMVAQRFRLQGLPGQRVEPHPILTLRPRDGLPMTLHPRA